MRPSRFTALLASALSLLAPVVLPAQTPAGSSALLAAPLTRITAPPSNTTLVTLKGNTPPEANSRYDRGVASASMATGNMTLVLKPSPAQSQALVQYLGALQNPQSPSYRKWLTPQQYGASFGVSAQDLQTVEQWLESQGFKIQSVPASLNLIRFSGTVGQVEQAFHTSIHRYVVNGVTHYSNNADPQIPAALAPVVAGVARLNDFLPRPMHVMAGHSAGARVSSHGSLPQGGVPQFTGTIDGSTTPFLFVTPSDAATIYDAPNSLNRNFTTGTTVRDGTGVNIGLVGDSDLQIADYTTFRKVFLGEANPPAPTQVVDGVDPGIVDGSAGIEALLDAENAAGLAPGANIYFYSSNDDLFDSGALNAALRAIEDNNVSILSVSFGACEAEEGVAGNEQLAADWQQAAAQGITVLVAAGDSGSAGCDSDAQAQAQGGLAVSGWASTPYNIAVGGTDFPVLAQGSSDFNQYVTTTENADYGTALSYIPENPWNDSISNNPPGAYTANTASQYSDGAGSTTTILASGGGGPSTAALCSVGADSAGDCPTGFASGYPLPSFQSSSSFAGTPLSGSTVRHIPDVSLFASPGDEHQAGWALCSDSTLNQDTSATYTDCQVTANGISNLDSVGGTSASTPAFAGILAQVEQQVGNRLGLANNVLYNLAATQYSTVFHDITAGNNSVPCASSTANCGSNGFLTGYNAGTGFDDATGLGSVDISKLVSAYGSVSFTPTSTSLTVNGGTSSVTVTHGSAVTLASTVTPSSATGFVSVVGPTGKAGGAVNEVIALSGGTGTLSGVLLPGGSYSINAYYPGDATHQPSSSGSIPVVVNPENSILELFTEEYNLQTQAQTQNPTSVPYGYYGYLYAEPINASYNSNTGNFDGVATGTVTLNNSGSAFNTAYFSATQTLNSEGVAAYPLYDLPPAAYSFTATYSGDSSYNASSQTTAVPLTITKAPTNLTISSSSSTIAASASVTISVQLNTDSTGAYPTGTITLTGNGQTFTASSVQQGTLSDGAVAELATFTVPGSSLAGGANTLTASYAGDGNYTAAGNATTTVTVSGSSSSAGFSLSGPSAGITVGSVGASATGTVTITPTNGFSGTVNLTCQFPVAVGSQSPTCSVPASVTISGTTPATATVTVNTTTQSAALAPGGSDALRRLLYGSGGVGLAAVLMCCVPARRRSWRSLLVALLAVGLLGAVGCGSSSNGSSGTTPGTYTLTVTGTSGSVTSNTTISVVVQ